MSAPAWTRTALRSGALATFLAVVGCTIPTPSVSVYDCAGMAHEPLQVSGDVAHVLVFTSHECPIAKGYAPTLRALHAAWQTTARVRLYLVHVDPDLTAAAAREHTRAYDLPGIVLLDPSHLLARRCGATITPEAVVYTSRGMEYRGRIDDQWRKLGSRAPEASRHDLRNAVDQVLAGLPVEHPHPKAVGCLLPEPHLDE